MLLMLLVIAIVVALDQWSKAIVVTRLAEGGATAGGAGCVRLRHVINRRPPWGSARGVRGLAFVWLLLSVVAMILSTLVEAAAARLALGATIGGATGNLIDGIFRGGVTDFIDLRVWPVFNLADAAIVAGVALAVWSVMERF